MVMWLRLHASSAGGMGWIPGQGTKIACAAQPRKRKKKEKVQLDMCRQPKSWEGAPTPSRNLAARLPRKGHLSGTLSLMWTVHWPSQDDMAPAVSRNPVQRFRRKTTHSLLALCPTGRMLEAEAKVSTSCFPCMQASCLGFSQE